MFEDHWYQHSAAAPAAAAPEPAPKLRRQEPARTQPPALGRTSTKAAAASRPGPPAAAVPRRPKSSSDLRAVAEATPAPPPPRPKSRSGLDALKAARYGRPAATKPARIASPAAIKDELDFADWYGGFSDDLEAAGSEYTLFRRTLSSHLNTCHALLSTTDQTLALLSTLQGSFRDVHAQTSAFQARSAALVSQQEKLTGLLAGVSAALHPFAELEPITRLLARPGSDFVKTPQFRAMLARLDGCLAWMEDPAHRGFAEVESYAPRFRQCMTRALTLARNYFVAGVREVAAEVAGRIRERQLNDTTQSALLYAKFRVGAPGLRELVGEIESRCKHEEYLSLLNECYAAFAGVRQKLIGPLIAKRMAELAGTASAKSKELVPFARSGISFVRSICMDEFGLFYAYFSGAQGDGEVYNFLESLCEPLYDALRPRIIHETQLVKLCELCTLIQTRYMHDPDDPDPDPLDHTQLDFSHLIQPPLHDTQNRIVFRAQAVLRDEIETFTPTPADLDYPAKLTPPPPPTTTTTALESSTEAAYTGWYPTLRTCILLLSRIYRLLTPAVFDDLAHTTVHLTTLSLVRAATQLQQRSPEDAQLFLIRHLLTLKAQLVAFEMDAAGAADTRIDFSALWEVSLFSRAGIVNALKGAAMPRVVEGVLDARGEVDERLRGVIGEFGRYWAGRMGVEVGGVERGVGELRGVLGVYLEDGRTREMLVGAVQELVIQAYEAYYERTLLSGKRNGGEAEVWDVETFVQWSNEVFGVGQGLLKYGQDEEEEGGSEGRRSRSRSRSGSL